MRWLSSRLGQRVKSALVRRGRTPGLRTAKTVLAVVASFLVAEWLHLSEHPVVAPLTALLVVQLTLYQSLAHGLGRVGGSDVRPIPGPRGSTAQPPGRVLLEFCRDREGDVLRFTTDIRVWPTNNISERGLRPVKTQQKISGRRTSEETTQDRLDICGSSTPSASTEPTSWLASATLSPVSCGGHRFPRRPDRRTSPTPTDLANPAGSRSPPQQGRLAAV